MQPEYYLSVYAIFNSILERDEFYNKNIKPFTGVEKPIFRVSHQDESCKTQELLELRDRLHAFSDDNR